MKVAALLLMCLSSALATYNAQGMVTYSSPLYHGATRGATTYQTLAPSFIKGRTYVTGAQPTYIGAAAAAPAYDYGLNYGTSGGSGFMAQVNRRVSSGLNYGSVSTGYPGNYQTGINYGFQSPSLYSMAGPTYGTTGYTGLTAGNMPAYTSVGMTASPSYNYGALYSMPVSTMPAYTSVGMTGGYPSVAGAMPAYTSVGTPGYSGISSMSASPSYNYGEQLYSMPVSTMPGGYPSVAGAMPSMGGYSYGMPNYQPAVGSSAMAVGPMEIVGSAGAGSIAGLNGAPAYGYDPLTMGFGYDAGIQSGFMGGFQQPIGIGGFQQFSAPGGFQPVGASGAFQSFGSSPFPIGGTNAFQYGVPGAY